MKTVSVYGMRIVGAYALAAGLAFTAWADEKCERRECRRPFVNDICLPEKLWMLDGVQNEIYIQPFLKRWRPYDDFVRFSMGNKPFYRQLGHVATIDKPVEDAVLRVELINGDEFETIKVLFPVLKVAKPGVGKTEVVAQIVGDSFTHGNFFWDALVREKYVPNLRLVGLRRPYDSPQCHEGRGGWALAGYFKVPTGERLSYHGFMQPAGGRYWGDVAFWKMVWRCVRKTQPKGFSPKYECEYFGDAAQRFDEQTGYVKAPMSGDIQHDAERGGFVRWNGTTWTTVAARSLSWSFDYGQYLEMWGLPKPKFLFEMLGVNDFSNSYDADFSEWKRNIETFQASYRKAVPDGKFVICIPCSSFGRIDNVTGQFVPKKNACMWRFRDWLLKTFDRREKEGYWVLDTALAVDSDYGYFSATNKPIAKPYAKYPGNDLLNVQYGNPHPYNSYPTMGVPLAAFIQYWRDR